MAEISLITQSFSSKSKLAKSKASSLKEHEKAVLDARIKLEELKADVKCIRYEIVSSLIQFTKHGQSLSNKTQDEKKIELEKKLKEIAEDIEKKEATEREILELYYEARNDYLQKSQRSRVLLAKYVRELRGAEGKKITSPENLSKLVTIPKDDDDSLESRKMVSDWRGQVLSEKNISFDVETGKLGEGAFGAVYKGKCFHTECAIKVLSQRNMNETGREGFKSEVITLSNMQHDRVLRFLGAVCDDKKMMLVTELCANGSMADRLFPPILRTEEESDEDYDEPRVTEKKKKMYFKLSPKKKLSMIRGIVEGMTYLHDRKITHYDLKPENILLDEEFNPVIADFGLARIESIEDVLRMSSCLGTPFYMAPEMLTSPVQLSPKCDVFAFGLLVWELWMQERNEWKETITQGGVNTNSLYKLIKEGKRPSFTLRKNKPFPPSLKHLISLCWDLDPEKRPNFNIMPFVADPEIYKKAKLYFQLKDTPKGDSTVNPNESRKLLNEISHFNHDTFFKIHNEILSFNPVHDWEKIVRIVENIPVEKKIESIDKTPLLWDKFVEQYPKIIGVPPFKQDEIILFRAFLIPNDTSEEPKVTKADYDLYLRFFPHKPNFSFFQELLNLPWYFGLYDSNSMALAFKDNSDCFLVRQSANISSFVISYKPSGTKDAKIQSVPLSTESLELPTLLKLLKDKAQLIKRIPSTEKSLEKSSKYVPLSASYKPKSLVIASSELKRYSNLLKGKSTQQQQVLSAGLYTTLHTGSDTKDDGSDILTNELTRKNDNIIS